LFSPLPSAGGYHGRRNHRFLDRYFCRATRSTRTSCDAVD